MADTESKAPSPVVQIDNQDPLPESNWLWRRVLVFVGMGLVSLAIGVVLLLLWVLSQQALVIKSERSLLDIIDALVKISFWLLTVLVIDRILYLVAPSAEQATKMIQTASLFKHGVTLKQERDVTATENRSTASTTTTVGKVGPEIPAIPDVPDDPTLYPGPR